MVRLCANHFGDNTCDFYPHPPLANLAFPGRTDKQVLTRTSLAHCDGLDRTASLDFLNNWRLLELQANIEDNRLKVLLPNYLLGNNLLCASTIIASYRLAVSVCYHQLRMSR